MIWRGAVVYYQVVGTPNTLVQIIIQQFLRFLLYIRLHSGNWEDNQTFVYHV